MGFAGPRSRQPLERAVGEPRRQVGPSGVDPLEDRPQLPAGDALEHVASRPGLHCGHQIVLVLGAGEHDDTGRRAGGRNLAGCLQATARHGHVQQSEIGSVLANCAHGRDGVADGGDHRQLLVGGERRDESIQEERVVVGDHDTDRFSHAHRSRLRSGAGRPGRRVPPSALDSSSSRPPSSSARSRMPVSPRWPWSGRCRTSKPGTLVADLDHQVTVARAGDSDLHACPAAMPGGVGEGLREDSVEGDLGGERRPIGNSLDVDRRVRAGPAIVIRHRPSHDLGRRGSFQLGRAKPRGDGAHLAERIGKGTAYAHQVLLAALAGLLRMRSRPRPDATWRRPESASGHRAGPSRCDVVPVR